MFSIITALYHSENYLPQYIRNLEVFAQAMQGMGIPFEVLIRYTDLSPKEDVMLQQLKKYQWCTIAEVKRRCAYSAWNEGVIDSKGEFVGFWNVDDIRFAESLREALSLFSEGVALVYFPFIIKRYIKIMGVSVLVYKKRIDGAEIVFDPQRFRRGMLCGPHFMFRKALYAQIGPFDEQFQLASDFDWCVRAVEHTGQFRLGKELSGIFRVDGTGLSSGKRPWREAENNTVFLRHGQPELVVSTSDAETRKYRVQEFLFREQWHSLSQLPTILERVSNNNSI